MQHWVVVGTGDIHSAQVTTCTCAFSNPLSPNGDQQQFSPNDIYTLSWD